MNNYVDYFCYVIFILIYFIPLFFCIIHLFKYIYKSEKKQVLTFVYAGFAIFFLFSNCININLIADIYDKVLNDVTVQNVDFHRWQEIGARVTGYSLMCAFLCNFSKALYTLHSLDHGIYNEVGDWGVKLKGCNYFKLYDFILRVFIAILFITMEFLLHKASEDPIRYFKIISLCGIGLYLSLIIWAGSTHFVLQLKGMTNQYIIGGCGLFNSFNIWYLTTHSKDVSTILIIFVLALISSCFLIFFICKYFYSNRITVLSPTPEH